MTLSEFVHGFSRCRRHLSGPLAGVVVHEVRYCSRLFGAVVDGDVIHLVPMRTEAELTRFFWDVPHALYADADAAELAA